MIVGRNSNKPWTDEDRLIMHAYQILQDERCQQCGSPVWLCHNSNRNLLVRIKEDVCNAKIELDLYRERHKDDKDGSDSAYHEFYTRDGSPLHLQRDIYYDDKIAELKAAREEDDDD